MKISTVKLLLSVGFTIEQIEALDVAFSTSDSSKNLEREWVTLLPPNPGEQILKGG